MKATKKIVCLALAIVMTALAFVMPVVAADEAPLVIVDGINSTRLYTDFGTENQKEAFFGSDTDIEAMITDVGGAFVGGLVKYGYNNKDFEAFGNTFIPALNKYFEPIAYNTDGTPKHELGFYETKKTISEYTEEERATLFTSFVLETAKKYGEDNTYSFSYDWTKSPVEVAKELNTFINYVRAEEGCKKVNVAAMSMGSVIMLSYLAEYGGKRINNCVFASPAWQGTSIVGNLFTGNIEIDIFAVENYLVKSADMSATTHLTAYIISFIASYEGLSHEYFGDINAAIQGVNPYLYRDSIIPLMAGMPGLWSLVPAEDFEAAKKFLFPEGIDPNLEAIIDPYYEIQTNAKQIIEDAEDDGMRFGIVCGYNRQMVPISSEYEQSDEVIDVKYMTGGATCALYLQAYDDWGQIYTQKNKDGHNHVSWDYKIDASTCMFPEQTWLIKNMSHSDYNADNGTLDTVIWLLKADKQYTVHTDKENHPQFSLYNTYKRHVTPIILDGLLGDVDNSGAVNTLDAKLALKIASGQVKATEYHLEVGDIDEDGEITTVDVRYILHIAGEIPYVIA
ncbi:MAG: hypothetical protein IJ025_02865 [Clostridia bacterium]|nr:hypothetical protein [Clostridia bacterium]